MQDTVRTPSSGVEGISEGTPTIMNRIGPQNDVIVSELHGRMYEQARNGNMFFAASQAATTSTIALATTYTGLCLSNPAGSPKDLIPRQLGVSLSVAPAAASAIGLGGGYAAAGVVTHTTPLTTISTRLGSGGVSHGLADGAATIVGTPALIIPTLGGFTAAALFAHGGVVDLDGAIVIPPGAYVFVYTLTVVVGFFGITWEEVPR